MSKAEKAIGSTAYEQTKAAFEAAEKPASAGAKLARAGFHYGGKAAKAAAPAAALGGLVAGAYGAQQGLSALGNAIQDAQKPKKKRK